MNPRILVCNIWSDKNKGDSAMQIAFIRMIKSSIPSASITLCSSFGANQMNLIKKETSLTLQESIEGIVGGPFPTYYLEPTASRLKTLTRAFLIYSYTLFLLLFARFQLANMLVSLLPKEFTRSLCAFKEADLVVLKTHNIRETPLIPGPVFLFKELYQALFSISLKKPLVLIGLSIWPLSNPLSRKIIQYILSRCLLVTVREDESLINMRNLALTSSNIPVLPDLSFYFFTIACKYSNNHTEKLNEKLSVGMTLFDWKEYGELAHKRYIDAIVRFVEFLTSKYHAHITIFPQVTFDPEVADEITGILVNRFGENSVTVVSEEIPPEKLFESYSKLDAMVATRLHSGIFSLMVGTPTVLISYDGGPKHKGIMKMLGLEDYVLDYENIEGELLIRKFEECLKNWSTLKEQLAERLNLMCERTQQHVYLLKNTLNL